MSDKNVSQVFPNSLKIEIKKVSNKNITTEEKLNRVLAYCERNPIIIVEYMKLSNRCKSNKNWLY